MKKALLVLVLLLTGVYFFYWQTSFETEMTSLDAIDAKFLNGDVLPSKENLKPYQLALKNYLSELNLKGDSEEKLAITELVEIKLGALDLTELNQEIELQEKLVNYVNPKCEEENGPEQILKAMYLEGQVIISELTEKIDSFKKNYAKYYSKASSIQKMDDLLIGFENYFDNSFWNIETLCEWT